MKICVTASGQGLDARVDERFGRAPFFVIVDLETMHHETIMNPAMDAQQGAGIAAAQGIAQKGVHELLTGFVGPKAFTALHAAGIRIFDGLSSTMDVRSALQQHAKGGFPQCKGANSPGRGRS